MVFREKYRAFIQRVADSKKLAQAKNDALGRINARLDVIERKIDTSEYFSHGGRATYVGNNRVIVKAVVAGHHIAYYVEADDRLLSPWFIITGGYETELTDYFIRELKPDSHSIDVGANFGYFTCLMARLCPQGRVVGIEVDEKIYEIVRDNVFINGFHGFTDVLHAAASNSDADVTLYRRSTRSGNTSIAQLSDDYTKALGEPPAQAFTIKGIRVDDLLPRMSGRVDFIKIDVEGAEPLVFEGARQTIATNPNLRIVMEWSPGQIQAAGFEIPAFLSTLREMGLESFDIHLDQLVPLSLGDLANVPYRAGIVLKRRS